MQGVNLLTPGAVLILARVRAWGFSFVECRPVRDLCGLLPSDPLQAVPILQVYVCPGLIIYPCSARQIAPIFDFGRLLCRFPVYSLKTSLCPFCVRVGA